MKFRLGQKVVCIDPPSVPLRSPWVAHPEQGQVYTVRGYRPDTQPSLLLYEIRNHVGIDGYEAGFFEDRFRPVVTSKTDISELLALQNKTPSKTMEPAA